MRGFTIILLCLFSASCKGQVTIESSASFTENQELGGPFENREMFFEGIPSEINAVDTTAAWSQGKTKLRISGVIYRRDGKTPVPDVILYYYHTDDEGLYSGTSIHGDLRGWVKSNDKGEYEIYTARPAAYPNRASPAHIHPAILEPGIEHPYYLDEMIFDSDKLATSKYRSSMDNRGGSGVLRTKEVDDVLVAEHDIILGLNIPGHPDEHLSGVVSGPEIGEDLVSFRPEHVWGADRGSSTCPVCKYGKYKGVIYFSGTDESTSVLEEWVVFFENEAKNSGSGMKIFVFSTGVPLDLEMIGMKHNLSHVALGVISEEELAKNKIDAAVGNAIFFYKQSRVHDKYIDIEPNEANFRKLSKRF